MNRTPSILRAQLRLRQQRMIASCKMMLASSSINLPFCLLTALQLLGLPIPRIIARYRVRMCTGMLLMLSKKRTTRTHKKNVGFYTMNLDYSDEIMEIRPGVFCTSPICTWFMMARLLTLEELVVLGDAILSQYGLCKRYTIDDFIRFMEKVECMTEGALPMRKRAPRGIGKCFRAIQLMRERVESPMESRCRLTMKKYRMPEPEVNQTIVTIYGDIYRMDLSISKYQIDIEYDGEFHQYQQGRDRDREIAIVDSGWSVVRVTKESLRDGESECGFIEEICFIVEQRDGERMDPPEAIPLERLTRARRKGYWRDASPEEIRNEFISSP